MVKNNVLRMPRMQVVYEPKVTRPFSMGHVLLSLCGHQELSLQRLQPFIVISSFLTENT